MGRRGNGEGTIHKRARDGLYEAKYTVQTESGPKRKTVYAKTRKEAAEKLAEALANRDKGVIFEVERYGSGSRNAEGESPVAADAPGWREVRYARIPRTHERQPPHRRPSSESTRRAKEPSKAGR